MAGTRQCIDSASASLTLSINLSDYRDLEVVVSYINHINHILFDPKQIQRRGGGYIFSISKEKEPGNLAIFFKI